MKANMKISKTLNAKMQKKVEMEKKIHGLSPPNKMGHSVRFYTCCVKSPFFISGTSRVLSLLPLTTSNFNLSFISLAVNMSRYTITNTSNR